MNDSVWASELAAPSARAILAALTQRDRAMPATWATAAEIFADYGAGRMQDRIIRALVRAYQSTDLRAGPVIVALLWRRVCAKVDGDQDRAQSLVVALLEVCRRYEHLDRADVAMRLISAAQDRMRLRSPAIRTVPLSELLPAEAQRSEPAPEAELLRPGEAAKRLGVTDSTLAAWAKEGRLESFRTEGGKFRYLASDIEAIRRKAQVLSRASKK